MILHRAAVAAAWGQGHGYRRALCCRHGVASAKGSMDATKAHLSGGERANQTPSGKVASAIRANMDQPEFKGNKFAGSTDTTLESDAVAFVNSK